MTITKQNYKSLKEQVEGKAFYTMNLNETYTALCYLSHRRSDEPETDQWWTTHQIGIVRERQRKLLAEQGIYVLTNR